MAKPFLSVIIPAHNEAERLPLTLVDADRHLANQEYSYEILVVDDGSTDATGAIAERFATLIRNLKVIRNSERLGESGAARIGMLATKGAWRLLLPASGAVPIEECDKLLVQATSAHDAVVGSRRVRGGRALRRAPWRRRFAQWLVNLFARLALRLPVKDALAPCLLISEDAANRVFSLTRRNRPWANIEAFALMQLLGLRVREEGIGYAIAPESGFRAARYLQLLWDAVKIRWWIRRGRYAPEIRSTKSEIRNKF